MKTEITFAQKRDEGRLKQLFLNSFDDTLGFVNMLFSHHFVPENTLVAVSDGDIVGMALLLPVTANNRKCHYLYGLCVDTAYRKNGIGSSIVNFARKEAEKRDTLLFLHPEDDSLFGFYTKLGFTPCGIRNRYFLTAEDSDSAQLLPVSADEYAVIRQNDEICGLGWSVNDTVYALKQEEFFGGSYWKTVIENKEYILLTEKCDGILTVLDSNLPKSALKAVANALADKYGCGKICFVLPPEYELGKTEICALGIGFNNPIYMNLLLE